MPPPFIHLVIGNGDFELDDVDSSFRCTADNNVVNSVGHKGESLSEQDDSSDIGDLGVNDGDNQASDDTKYTNDSSSSSPFNAQDSEDGEECEDIGEPSDNNWDDHASDDTEYANNSLSSILFNARNGDNGKEDEDCSDDCVDGDVISRLGNLRNDEDVVVVSIIMSIVLSSFIITFF